MESMQTIILSHSSRDMGGGEACPVAELVDVECANDRRDMVRSTTRQGRHATCASLCHPEELNPVHSGAFFLTIIPVRYANHALQVVPEEACKSWQNKLAKQTFVHL
eukprot:70469-Amphidinium_carterae.2